MKRFKLLTLPVLLLTLSCFAMSCGDKSPYSENAKSKDELLVGSWCQIHEDDSLKLTLYWHFNEDNSEQMISISTIDNEITPTITCGTWEIEGDTIKTVNLSGKEKIVSEWKILKLDKDSLQIEFYDKQPKRFIESFKRINK